MYLQDKFGIMKALDGKTDLDMLAYEAPKVRLLRSLSIQGNDGMQVLFSIYLSDILLPIYGKIWSGFLIVLHLIFS